MKLLSATTMGILIGLMVGLSSSPIVAATVTAAFALVGAAIGIKGGEATRLARTDVATAASIASFALTCAIGIVLGTIARTHRWLEPSTHDHRRRLIAAGASATEATNILIRYELNRLALEPTVSLAAQYQELLAIGFDGKEARALLAERYDQNTAAGDSSAISGPGTGALFSRSLGSCTEISNTHYANSTELVSELQKLRSPAWNAVASVIAATEPEPPAATLPLLVRVVCAAHRAAQGTP